MHSVCHSRPSGCGDLGIHVLVLLRLNETSFVMGCRQSMAAERVNLEGVLVIHAAIVPVAPLFETINGFPRVKDGS